MADLDKLAESGVAGAGPCSAILVKATACPMLRDFENVVQSCLTLLNQAHILIWVTWLQFYPEVHVQTPKYLNRMLKKQSPFQPKAKSIL